MIDYDMGLFWFKLEAQERHPISDTVCWQGPGWD